MVNTFNTNIGIDIRKLYDSNHLFKPCLPSPIQIKQKRELDAHTEINPNISNTFFNNNISKDHAYILNSLYFIHASLASNEIILTIQALGPPRLV